MFFTLVVLKIETFLCKNIFSMSARNYKAQFGFAITLYSALPHSLRRTHNPCDHTMKISSRYHRLLIYDVKKTTKIDGMGPFNLL